MISRFKGILISMRPWQWAKNLFLFTGLLFSKNLFQTSLLVRVAEGFILFCFAASSIYIYNDIQDRLEDRRHPIKGLRPLAKGTVKVPQAYGASILLAGVALVLGFVLDRVFSAFLLVYLLLNLAYSLKIKEIVILDVMFVASGFFLRVLAGTTLAGVTPSDWLIICTITLSLFVGFSKRRNELVLLGENADYQRKVLKHYSISFLEQMISIMTACSIMSYILYTVSPETVERFGTRNLVFTVPFVLFGIFRYFYLIYLRKMTENPIDLILKDIPSLLNVLLWLGAILLIIY